VIKIFIENSFRFLLKIERKLTGWFIYITEKQLDAYSGETCHPFRE
jgi:hypothetical protein